jgi:cysteine-rich repeat protein
MDCPVGSPYCPCTQGGACDPGYVCDANICVPDDCVVGANGCPCTGGGGCDAGLVCTDNICGPPDGMCGNAMLEGAEQCDDGNTDQSDDCTNACMLATCGDGYTWIGHEQCDDGDSDNMDTCTTECMLAACGDGYVGPGEGCDDGNLIDDDACSNACALPSCGDGIVQMSEQCDDGNAANTDDCLDTCVVASCGDGYAWAGMEDCDDANPDNTDACLANCTLPSCGDGYVQTGVEECDDGNMIDTDSCVAGCKDAMCGDGFVLAGTEECDDANMVNTDTCLDTCVAATCGDGFVGPGEGCDDGNMVDNDGCTNACTLPGCGDGIVQMGEECDDGNMVDTDACLTSCVDAECGDGQVWMGMEDCDDGNADDTDACLTSCVDASCGDGKTWAGNEGCDDGNATNSDGCNNDCVVSGSVVATATFDVDGGKDLAYGVAIDSSGNPVVVGRQSIAGVLDIWVRKYTAALSTTWTQTYNNGEGNAYARAVATDGSGNIFVTGRLTFLASNGDIFIRKHDASGAEVWLKTWNGTNNSTDEGRGIAVDGSGNVLVAGDTSTPMNGVDGWLRKHDAAGNQVWVRTFDGGLGNTDRLHAVATGPSDVVYVTGEIRSDAAQGGNIFVRQYNAAGTTVWWKDLNYANENDLGSGVAVNGSVAYITGRVRNVANLDDTWTRKYDSAGVIQWTKSFNGAASGDDVGRAVAVAPDGAVVVAGDTLRAGTGVDVLVRKYAADGTVLWTQELDGGTSNEDRGYGVAVASDGYVFVAGQRGVTAADFDVWVLKLAQ